MEQTKGIDIFELGKKEKVVRLLDPENAEKFSEFRLIKMNKKEAGECFDVSDNVRTGKRISLQKEESENKKYATVVAGFSVDDVVDMLVSVEKAEKERNIDLIEIAGEKEMDKKELLAAQKEYVAKWEIERTAEIKKEKEPDLRKRLVDLMIETEIVTAGNKAFFESALGCSCYFADKDERIFSPGPEDPRHISNLRDERIYSQLMAAYRDFSQVFSATPKEVRDATKVGSDFTIFGKSGKNTTGSHS